MQTMSTNQLLGGAGGGGARVVDDTWHTVR